MRSGATSVAPESGRGAHEGRGRGEDREECRRINVFYLVIKISNFLGQVLGSHNGLVARAADAAFG